MLLLAIQMVDQRWEFDDDAYCLELFHKILTYTFVTAFRTKYTAKRFDEFCSAFNVLEESGLDMEEILATDLTMIKRFKS